VRLDESVRGLSAISTEIADFRLECEDKQHTDIGEIWELMTEIEQAIGHVLVAWNNDKGSSRT